MKNSSSRHLTPGAIVSFENRTIGAGEWTYSCGTCRVNAVGFDSEFEAKQFGERHEMQCYGQTYRGLKTK